MQSEKKAAIYCRVSTTEQHTGAQESELKRFAQGRGWTIFKVYTDKGYSGATTDRPAFQELLSDVRHHRFDIILCSRLDRIARSLRELINAVELCRRHKIAFVSFNEGIDTSSDSATSELTFQIFGAVAQFERALIGARVRAGLEHAREQGRQIGRPAKKRLSGAEEKAVIEAHKRKSTSLRKLAKQHGTTVWQVSRVLAENGLSGT